eukprot:2890649-Amphidinium_carterae.1
MRQSQAQQLRRRRSTPPRNVQHPRELVAIDNAAELAFAQRQMTIDHPSLVILCVTIDDNPPVHSLQLLWLDNQSPSYS